LYEERVLEEIELDIEPAAKEKRKKRNFDIRMDILEDMAKKYRRDTVYENITDEDEVCKFNLGIQPESKQREKIDLIVLNWQNNPGLYIFFTEYLCFMLTTVLFVPCGGC
jgi:hypothetical protein